MSYQMIHMETAYRLLEKIDIYDKASYILGSVAPDSVHMNESFSTSMKVKSHMFEGCGEWRFTSDHLRWKDNIKTFYLENVAKEQDLSKRSFGMGVCVHNLTDISNDVKIWLNLRDKYIPPMDLCEFQKDFYVEAVGIDQWLYQNSIHRPEIESLLQEGRAYDAYGLLLTKDLEKQRYHLLYEQYKVKEVDVSEYKYITKEKLEEFVKETVEDISRFFQENR